MNETYYIKIVGKVNVEKKLEISHNIKLEMDCSATTETKEDNEDGTFNLTTKVIPITCKIIQDNGEIIKGKDTRSRSQKLRSRIWSIWNESKSAEDFETFYDKSMVKIITNADIIIYQ